MWNAGLGESQAGIKIFRINNLKYANSTTLMAESEEELKSPLMRMKKESEKAGLKLSIKKTKIMASSHMMSWWIEGGKVEAVTDLIFLFSKIVANGDCSHEIKRCLLLERDAMTIVESVLKSRDIIFPKKFKVMVLPVVMYRWENWTTKKAKCWIIEAFELWCWRRLFGVPWTANESILKEKDKSFNCVQLFATPWTVQSMEFSSQNTGLGSLSLLQGIFPTQESNPGLLHCRQILYLLIHKGSLNIHWKNWWHSWSSNTLATWCKEPIHWKRSWRWERLKAKREGSGRGWDG